MTSSMISPDHCTEQEQQVWNSLQQAISDCSGFQQWQAQQETDKMGQETLDQQVRSYLRETLETLAY